MRGLRIRCDPSDRTRRPPGCVRLPACTIARSSLAPVSVPMFLTGRATYAERADRFLGWLDAGAALVGGDQPSPLVLLTAPEGAVALPGPRALDLGWRSRSLRDRGLRSRVGRFSGWSQGRGVVAVRR